MSQKIIIVGYYDHSNLGDELFRLAFEKLLNGHTLTFVDVDQLLNYNAFNYDAIVLGGGDVVNDYFIDKVWTWINKFKSGIRCYAYSVGIPFPSAINDGKINLFDYVVCRNREDMPALKSKLGAYNVEYLPDFVFSLDVKKKAIKVRNKVCVSLARQCCRDKKVFDKLVILLNNLSQNYEVVMIPFNTNTENINENDIKIAMDLKEKVPLLNVIQETLSMKEVIRHYKESKFVLCMRLHSHVLSIMANTPFVSIYSTRKVKNMIYDYSLEEYSTPMILDCKYCKNVPGGCASCNQMCGTPVDFDLLSVEENIRNVIANDNVVRKMFKGIADANASMLANATFDVTRERDSAPFFINNTIMTERKTKIVNAIIKYVTKAEGNPSDIKMLKEESVLKFLLKYNVGNLNLIADDICKMICLDISGTADPAFLYGLRQQILTPEYSLFDSLHYLLSLQYSTGYVRKEIINPSGPFNMLALPNDALRSYHYGGWSFVMDNMYKKLHNPNGIMLDAFVDRSFHWENDYLERVGILPYKSNWAGFIHHHASDNGYSPYNCVNLLKKPNFLKSLDYCKCLFVMATSLKEWLVQELNKIGYDIPIVVLTHPTPTPTKLFTFNSFKINTNRKILEIGAWLRNSYSIYQLNTDLHKVKIKGTKMENNVLPPGFSFDKILNYGMGQDEGNQHSGCLVYNKYIEGMVKMLKENDASVEIVEKLSNLDYDFILSENIIFLDLVDIVTSNTVIEAIVRNTPILINKLPGTVELLGEKYPFYYENLYQAREMSNDLKLIEKTTDYLRSMNKNRFDINTFINAIRYTPYLSDVTKF